MRPDKIKISVLVPVRDAAKVLPACLESLAGQTRPFDELIVVDNDSSDRTKDVITSFTAQHKNVRYIFEPRRGRGNARNAGIRQSSGDIIVMTDADCTVPADWLARMVQPIVADNESVVTGFEDDAVGNYWSRRRQADDLKFIQSKIKGGYVDHLDTKNFAIRTDLMKDLMFDPTLIAYEDWDFFLRLKQRNIAIRFLPDLLVRHHHDASFWELATTQFSRGRNAEKIIKQYQYSESLRKHLNINERGYFNQIKDLLCFLLWDSPKKPMEAPYGITAELAWKFGMLISKFERELALVIIALQRSRLGIQLHTNEIYAIKLRLQPPMDFLVFGLGNDSIFWHNLNRGGRTIFLEDDPIWFKRLTIKYPQMEAYLINYDTHSEDWRELIERPEKLALDLPSGIRGVKWDLILVDGPAGYAASQPGRMKSIYAAAQLIKEGGSVFVHDCDREIEREYAKKYLGEENMTGETAGRAIMRQYRGHCR